MTEGDIDDPSSVYDGAGETFSALLRDLAMEHRRIQLQNSRLLAEIANGSGKDAEEISDRQILVALSDQQQTESQLPAASPDNETASPNPANSSSNLQLHEMWTQSREAIAAIQNSPTRSLAVKRSESVVRGGDVLRDDEFMQRFIIGPNTCKRTFWDLFSVIILSIDIVMVPMIAFDIPETVALTVINLSCTIFWTLDIALSFLTGFHIEGTTEMRPKKVFYRYWRTWFPFDCVVILLDWLLFAFTSGIADVVGIFRMSKLLRFGRILRALRLVRLLRLMKMPALFDDLIEYMQSDGLTSVLRLLSALFAIAIANHFLACGWYAVGRASTPSWITEFDEDGRDLVFRYVTALHWSLTQFTPASMEVHAKGLPERIYSICVLFIALVVFSSFVSSITNAMNHLRSINEGTSRQRNNLRRYINENRLSLDLSNRIIVFAKRMHKRIRYRVHEHEIDVFKALPESLRLQLDWEVYVPILSAHPFFFMCAEHLEPFLLEVCHCALHEKSLMSSQELFNKDEEAKHMYFLIAGCLEYFEGKSEYSTILLNKDEWCGEVALWLSWFHRGQLVAVSHCELVTLDASVFRRTAAHSLQVYDICKTCALYFQKYASQHLDLSQIDMFHDHDVSLEMSQIAFKDVAKELNESALNDSFGVFAQTWHSMNWFATRKPSIRSQTQRKCATR